MARCYENPLERDWLAMADRVLALQPAKEDKPLRGTIYTGGAGIAFAFWQNHIRNGSKVPLEHAKHLLSKCRPTPEGPTFFFGLPGLHLMQLLVAHAENNVAKRTEAITALRMAANEALMGAPSECEMLYGRAGALYALLFAKVHADAQYGAAEVRPFIEQILAEGKAHNTSALPLNFVWHHSEYLGAAHGHAGILTTLLLAHKHIAGSVRPDELETILATVEALAQLRLANKNLPTKVGSQREDLVHWCHGAPGDVPLFVHAAAVDPARAAEWMIVAEEFAEVVWQRGLLKKVCVCVCACVCHSVWIRI